MFQRMEFSRTLLVGTLVLSVLVICSIIFARGRVSTVLANQAVDALDQQWAAMKGYLRIEDAPRWYYDQTDPDQASAVAKIRTLFLLTDKTGRPLEQSRAYQMIGAESPQEISGRVNAALSAPASGRAFWSLRKVHGAPFMVRAGVIFDELHREPYYAAIATPLTASGRATNLFTWISAFGLACATLLGWCTGRIFSSRPNARSNR